MYMAPLMTLSSDDIVELSLLKPMGNKHRTPPTLEEEATLLGEEIKLPPVPGSSLEPAKGGTALCVSSPPPFTNLTAAPF